MGTRFSASCWVSIVLIHTSKGSLDNVKKDWSKNRALWNPMICCSRAIDLAKNNHCFLSLFFITIFLQLVSLLKVLHSIDMDFRQIVQIERRKMKGIIYLWEQLLALSKTNTLPERTNFLIPIELKRRQRGCRGGVKRRMQRWKYRSIPVWITRNPGSPFPRRRHTINSRRGRIHENLCLVQ